MSAIESFLAKGMIALARPRKPKRIEDYPDILTADETAELLRVGRDTVFDDVRRGRIPAARIGRKIRISKMAIMRILDTPIEQAAQTHQPSPDDGRPPGGGKNVSPHKKETP